MTKHLIVNADDLGISPGVNQGVLEAHQNGIVTSTTVMINLPDAEDGIRKIQEEAPDMGIGLHINLTYGTPVLAAEKIPSMVLTDGIFPSIKEMIQSLTTYNGEEIQAEIVAQFEQFNRLAGTIPDHLDTHQFATNILPAAFDTMLKLAAQHDIPLRNADNFLSLESLKRFIAIFQRGSILVTNSENLKSDIQVQLLQETRNLCCENKTTLAEFR